MGDEELCQKFFAGGVVELICIPNMFTRSLQNLKPHNRAHSSDAKKSLG